MSTETGKVAKNSVLYSIASILTKASGLLLMPIYSNVKYLTEEEYGEYNLLIQFAYAALFFCEFGTESFCFEVLFGF